MTARSPLPKNDPAPLLPDQDQPGNHRLAKVLLALAIAALTAFCVFVLPFFFPLSHPSFSVSYTAGFNNKVAVVATAMISLIALTAAWRFNLFPPSPQIEDRSRIPLWMLCVSIAACVAFTAALGWMLCKTQIASNDDLYFLEYMDDIVRYHQRIYSGFSFNYGPLLLYFPIWVYAFLRHFHVGIQGSYYVALALAEAAGQVLLYLTLESLPLSRKIKVAAFWIFTIGALCPALGMNYTFVRFLAPFSTLLFASRAKNPTVLALFFLFGEMLQLAISPELGLAFAAGACFYALCLTLQKGWAWIPAIAAPPLGVGVFLAIAGKQYLNSIGMFSKGGYNLVIEPLFYILFFLAAVVWLIPLMLAGKFKERRPEAVLMASLFIVCLGLLPPALGFCDLLHVFFNGAGLYLLAIVAISAYRRDVRQLWLFALAGILVWTQFMNFMTRLNLRYASGIVLLHRPAPRPIDIRKLQAIVGNGKISAPFWIPYSVENQLKEGGLYLPDRDCSVLSVWDASSEAARATRLDTSRWALIPVNDPRLKETPKDSALSVGLGYKFYPERRQPYVYGDILLNDIRKNWTPIARFDEWELYRNNLPVLTPPVAHASAQPPLPSAKAASTPATP
ncbi:MAG: hypothetical protein WA634_02900 [Silvibacterium sp.]